MATLYVHLARDVPRAIILRRGPSAWVQMILWRTDSDTFEPGQWMAARIYERRCDLSADGELFIYFCRKSTRRNIEDASYTDSWTAISRPPNFTALALWPKGDAWDGGGLFESKGTVWLNHFSYQSVPHPQHQPHRLHIIPGGGGGEDMPIYRRRLARDGWVLEDEDAKWPANSRRAAWNAIYPLTWRKPHPSGHLTLEMIVSYPDIGRLGGYWNQWVAVKDAAGRNLLVIEDAQWADWDQRGRLAVARSGQLSVHEAADGTLGDSHLLADFTGHRPERTPPPEWAARWPWDEKRRGRRR